MIKDIFQDVLTELKNMNAFKWILIFNNQIDRARLGLINFNCPACFVEIQHENIVNLQSGITGMDLKVRFHVVYLQLDGMKNTMDQNFDVFALRDMIRKKFVNYFPKGCGPLQADGEDQDYKHNNLYHYIINFKCHWIDTSAYTMPQILSGYIVWNNQPSPIWNECLDLWNEAYWGAYSLSDHIIQ